MSSAPEISDEMLDAIREDLADLPEAEAAFLWLGEGDPDVLVVLNCGFPECAVIECENGDLQARFELALQDVRSRFPTLTFGEEHWNNWRGQDTFAGHREIYRKKPEPRLVG